MFQVPANITLLIKYVNVEIFYQRIIWENLPTGFKSKSERNKKKSVLKSLK